MADYNFEPDYAAWWKKKGLSKEDLCWLMLGFSPDDIAKNIRISNDENSTHEEKQWNTEFGGHCYDCAPFLGNEFRNNMKLLQCESKEDIFQEAYESYIKIYPAFYDFLLTKKVIKPREDLETYKDHSLFEKNTAKGEQKIINENYAFAKVIGVEESCFDRFICLDDICENEPVDKNDFRAYAKFKPEQKWFYSEYGKFIGKFYDAHHSDVTRFVRKIKSYNLWSGEFEIYCQNLHDSGFIFRKKTYEALRQQGIDLKYSEEGWAYNFYSEWVKRKLHWGIDVTIKLYNGGDPDGGREFHGFGEYEKKKSEHGLLGGSVVFYDNNGEMKLPNTGDFHEETSVENFVKRHIAKGTITPSYENKGKLEFEPLVITKFFKQYCPNTFQPQALFDVLGIHENNNTEIKALSPVGSDGIEERRRVTPWHQDLTKAILEAQTKLGKSPSPNEVFKYIRDNSSKFEHIQKKEQDSKGEMQVWITNANGSANTITWKAFADRTSKIKSSNSK